MWLFWDCLANSWRLIGVRGDQSANCRLFGEPCEFLPQRVEYLGKTATVWGFFCQMSGSPNSMNIRGNFKHFQKFRGAFSEHGERLAKMRTFAEFHILWGEYHIFFTFGIRQCRQPGEFPTLQLKYWSEGPVIKPIVFRPIVLKYYDVIICWIYTLASCSAASLVGTCKWQLAFEFLTFHLLFNSVTVELHYRLSRCLGRVGLRAVYVLTCIREQRSLNLSGDDSFVYHVNEMLNESIDPPRA